MARSVSSLIQGTSPAAIPQPRPYRVALLHPSVGINWSGGGEIFALEFARRLNQDPDFEVELLSGANCGSFSRPIPCISRKAAYALFQKPVFKSCFHRLVTHPEVVTEHLTSFLPAVFYLLRHRFDLIYPHNDYAGLAIASLVRWLKGTPILFTEHNGLLHQGKCLKRNLRFHPDHLIVFDQIAADFVHRINPQQNTSIIPNGVDLVRFGPGQGGLEFGLLRPTVLCTASLWRNAHKRVELAIEAIARLPEVSLLICGDGPDRAYFQAMGERLLGEARFAIRTFPFDQMPQVYQSVDAFTLPSQQEPFGLVYLEAMASGLPVVATDDAMRRLIVGNSGILCDVTNLDQYATAIREALRGNWSRTARQNAARFSWDRVMQQYRAVMIDVIERSRLPGGKRLRCR